MDLNMVDELLSIARGYDNARDCVNDFYKLTQEMVANLTNRDKRYLPEDYLRFKNEFTKIVKQADSSKPINRTIDKTIDRIYQNVAKILRIDGQYIQAPASPANLK